MRRVHCKSGKPYDVYIGRPSQFGNPYVIGRDGTREEVITKYRIWIRQQKHLTDAVRMLYGKTLACWCFDNQACHGDVLIEYCEELNAAITAITERLEEIQCRQSCQVRYAQGRVCS